MFLLKFWVVTVVGAVLQLGWLVINLSRGLLRKKATHEREWATLQAVREVFKARRAAPEVFNHERKEKTSEKFR